MAQEVIHAVKLQEDYNNADSRIRQSHPNAAHAQVHQKDIEFTSLHHTDNQNADHLPGMQYNQALQTAHSTSPAKHYSDELNFYPSTPTPFSVAHAAAQSQGSYRPTAKSTSSGHTFFNPPSPLNPVRTPVHMSNTPSSSLPRQYQPQYDPSLQSNLQMAVDSPGRPLDHHFSSPYLPQLHHLAGDLLRADSRNSNASWSTQLSQPLHMAQYGGVPVSAGYPTLVSAQAPHEAIVTNLHQGNAEQAHRAQARMLAQAIRDGLGEEPEATSGFKEHSRAGRGMPPPPNAQASAQIIPYTYNTGTLSDASGTTSFDVVQRLTRHGRPSLTEACELIPFIEQARCAKPVTWGVIKIMNVSDNRAES